MDLPWKKFDRRPKTVEAAQVHERTVLPQLEEGKPKPVANPGDYVVKWQVGKRELLVPFEKEIFEMEYTPQPDERDSPPMPITQPQVPASIDRRVRSAGSSQRIAAVNNAPIIDPDKTKEPEG